MGDKIDKTREKLKKKEISNLRFIIFLIGVALFIYMDTNMFRNMEDFAKVMIYIALWGTFAVFGIELMPAKEIGLKMKDIYINRKLTWHQKAIEYGNIAMDLLNESGVMWQIGKEEQFSPDNIERMTGQKIEKV